MRRFSRLACGGSRVFRHFRGGLRCGDNGGLFGLCPYALLFQARDCDWHVAAGKFQTVIIKVFVDPNAKLFAQRKRCAQLGDEFAADYNSDVVALKHAPTFENLC